MGFGVGLRAVRAAFRVLGGADVLLDDFYMYPRFRKLTEAHSIRGLP